MHSLTPAGTAMPQKLSWVTTPLLILLIVQGLSLLVVPFMAPLINSLAGVAAADPEAGLSAQDLGMLKLFTGATLWLWWVMAAAWAAFLYFTWRAARQGKSWARIAAIVVGVLSLLNFPLGTVLGVFLLIGVFDQDVQRFLSR